MDQSWAVLSNCVLQGIVSFISVLQLCLVDSSAMQSGVCAVCVCAVHARAKHQFAFFLPHVQATAGLMFILLGHSFWYCQVVFLIGCDD
jgi:hypothetical protein